MKKNILMTSNTSWYLYNFRRGTIKTLLKEGYEVSILAPTDHATDKLIELGCKFYEIEIDGKSKNPLKDMMLVLKFIKKFKKIKPHMIINSTIKPNIYGTIAAGLINIPVINNVSGLGNIFSEKNLTRTIVETLYKIAYRTPKKIFFQNNDDMKLFIDSKICRQEIADRVPGSGVNIEEFYYLPKTIEDEKIKILFIGRMLWDKGVGDLVEVSRRLKAEYPNLEIQLLGQANFNNPTAIKKEEIEAWEKEGLVKYLGTTNDVKSIIREVDLVALPSKYREGVPRSLIEAAAMEKPIVTYNNVGCRDIVEDGFNGYLCEFGNVDDLSFKIERFLNLNAEERKQLGKNGREKVVREFDENIVIAKYLEEIKKN